jgi:glutaredoxin 3
MLAEHQVVMYTTRFCPYCIRARRVLDEKGVTFKDIGVDGDFEKRRQMETMSGRHTVPQIWIGARHIGGFDDLCLLERRGELDALLAAIE